MSVGIAVLVGMAVSVGMLVEIKIWQVLAVPTIGSPKMELAHKTPFVYVPDVQVPLAPYLTSVVPVKLQKPSSAAQVVHVGVGVEVGVWDGMDVWVGMGVWVAVIVCVPSSLFNGLTMLINVLPIMGARNSIATRITRATNTKRKAYSTNPCPFSRFFW